MKSSEPTPNECRTKYQHHIAPKKKNKMQRNNLFFSLDAILKGARYNTEPMTLHLPSSNGPDEHVAKRTSAHSHDP